MENKQIIIDGLSCDNCPESKRCQEQQTKKEYAINQVLQEIPSEYANIINRLKQIIPSITRCDYVLEKQLKRKEQECEELRRSITKIFACLIKANRTNKIVDTIWVDNITTLWDYIALTLGIEGDQTQIEEQILQKNQLI